jgi:hypothetical protein
MNIKIENEILSINSEGFIINIKAKNVEQKIKELISLHICTDEIVTEVSNEIDMELKVVVSGSFVTDAYYGIADDGSKVFISRDVVRFNPNLFNQATKYASLPFYVIQNRYSVNSVTKKRYQFARVFQNEDEMYRVYRNTVKFLKLKRVSGENDIIYTNEM